MNFFRYRLKYRKVGPARYIGHLDLQSLFQRAIRRAGLRSRYSEGFNPHPIISFAAPLSVGMEGLGEIVDIDLMDDTPCTQVVVQMNNALPSGFTVLECQEAAFGQKSAASLLRKAEYSIAVRTESGEPDLEESVSRFKEAGEKMQELVFELSARNNIITATIACGGSGNLKPQVLAEELCRIADVKICPYSTEYTRRGLLF